MKRIKLFCCLAAAALFAAGCGALFRTPEEMAQEEARIEQLVAQRLSARKYRVNFNFMNPSRGGSRAIDPTYGITVNDKHLISYLPYFGVAYDLPYGGGKGLNFESEIDEYSVRERRDRQVIEFTTKNDEDIFLYHLEVFPNGRADLRVRSRNREQIDYQGHLDEEFDPDEAETEN